MQGFTDFFDQFTKVLNDIFNIISDGIDNLSEVPQIFNYLYARFNLYLNFVHPAFHGILVFAIASALVIRFLRLD